MLQGVTRQAATKQHATHSLVHDIFSQRPFVSCRGIQRRKPVVRTAQQKGCPSKHETLRYSWRERKRGGCRHKHRQPQRNRLQTSQTSGRQRNGKKPLKARPEAPVEMILDNAPPSYRSSSPAHFFDDLRIQSCVPNSQPQSSWRQEQRRAPFNLTINGAYYTAKHWERERAKWQKNSPSQWQAWRCW